MSELGRTILLVVLVLALIGIWWVDDQADQANDNYIAEIENEVILWGEELEERLDALETKVFPRKK